MITARRVAICVFGPVVLYLCLAVVGALAPSLHDDVGPKTDERWIVLVSGPIHYDILIPIDDDTRAEFAFLADGGVPIDHFGATWLSVGWGSEAFYTTAGSYLDINARAVWRAATGDNAVMRFEVYGALPVHPDLRRVSLSQFQLDAMRHKILSPLGPDPVALPIDGFSATDAFYPARGRFNLLWTCNDWVGSILSGSGLKFGLWTPTPYAVTLSLWWNGHLD